MTKHRPLIYALILVAINFLIFLFTHKASDHSFSFASSDLIVTPTPTPTATVTPSNTRR